MNENELKSVLKENIQNLINANKGIINGWNFTIILTVIFLGIVALFCNINKDWLTIDGSKCTIEGTVLVSFILAIVCLTVLAYTVIYYYDTRKNKVSKEYYDLLHHLVNAAMELEKAQSKTQEDTIKQIIKEQLSKETIEKAIKDAIQEPQITESLTTTVQETIRKQLSTEKDNIAELIKKSNAKIETIETTLNQVTAQTVEIDKLTKILNAIKGFFSYHK